MSLIGQLAEAEPVIKAEGVVGVPAAVIPVKAGEGDVMANAVVGRVLPDCCFEPSKTKLVDWLARCCVIGTMTLPFGRIMVPIN